MAKENKTAKPTKEQIELWRKEHGEVFHYTVEDKQCWLRPPNRKTFSMVTTISGGDGIKNNELLLENCWLAGDEEIKTNDAYFLSISTKLGDIVSFKDVEVKKL